MGLFGERSQPRDLHSLPLRIRWRQSGCRLEPPHLLSELEPLGQQVHERGIDVIDALAQTGQLDGDILLDHGPNLPGKPLQMKQTPRQAQPILCEQDAEQHQRCTYRLVP